MIVMPKNPDDFAHGDRKFAAVIRHNVALKGHAMQPMSTGEGIQLHCGCGSTLTFDGAREHIYGVCRDTPIRIA